MNSLKTLIREYLRTEIYQAFVVLRSSKENNITLISDNIRGLCGVTVCDIVEPATDVSTTTERTLLRVKFHWNPQIAPSVKEQMRALSREARRIDGVHSFIVKSVQRFHNRIYTA